MKKINPYIIVHVHLESGINSLLSVLARPAQYYVVFWWHSVALGDKYIDNYQAEDSPLHEIIFSSIEPGLKNYTIERDSINSLKHALITGDFAGFTKLMDKEFYNYFPDKLPATVNLSVVICTRQRSKSLQHCLDSLVKQECRPGEIIVIDNAPLDESTKQVVEQFEGVIYHKEPRPGLDIARNTGAMMAKNPVIAYTDDDVQLHPLWSYRVWETFQAENCDAMTGLIIAVELETESQQIFEQHWGFNKGYSDKQFDHTYLRPKNGVPQVWNIGAGANMAFKKTLLEKMNYFDERLDVGAAGCSGDSELWYRILAAGYIIQYNPRAIVYHEHRKSLQDLHKQLYSYMRGHAAAALIQHKQNPSAGYKKYLFRDMPAYYYGLIKKGFPKYNFRYRTLWSEINGLISGIKFYKKNKTISSRNK